MQINKNALALLLSCFLCFPLIGAAGSLRQAAKVIEPALPLVFLDTSVTASNGKVIPVAAGEDLQAALDAAALGDVLVLEAGAVFTGNFTLPNKTEGYFGEWITIRSSATDELMPAETRVAPSQTALMPRLVSPNEEAALEAAAGAHSYRLIGIEFTISAEVTRNYGIVRLGSGNETDPETLPRDIIIDRCYIHGHDSADVARGVALNSVSSAVIDSHISECHGVGFDTQAICGWNGPGPFKIVNNYLEGAGENVMFGGADPKIDALVPSDIEFRRNHCFKPLSWKRDEPDYAGKPWTVKNSFELKNARRVLVDGNIFENNWADGQVGFAILFTPRNQENTAPWSVVEDVTFTNNIVKHTAGGLNVLGRDYNSPSEQTKRIKVKNNLFDDVGGQKWGSNGRFLQINETADIEIDHNTVLHTGNIITAHGEANERFVFTNNLIGHNEYGVIGDGTGPGMSTLTRYFPGVVFKKNVIVGGQKSIYSGKKNHFPATFDVVGFADQANGNYRLSAASPYKNAGTNDKDIGADIDLIEVATGAVAEVR